MNTKSTKEKLKQLPKRHRSSSIPASLWFASLAAFFMVSIGTIYAIDQIRQLERSNKRLLQASRPLTESAHHLETLMWQTTYLLHKAMTLEDPVYFQAIAQKEKEQKVTLETLRALLADAPEALHAMERLLTSLEDYWQLIRSIWEKQTNVIPRGQEQRLETEMADLYTRINKLAIELAVTTGEAADKVTTVLLIFVIGTAIFGILVSVLFAAAATRPLRKIRQALTRIGSGQFDQNLNLEGLNELRELSYAVNTMQSKLQGLEQAKTEFLSMISHELKTPLASFQSGTELLYSGGVGALSGDQQKIVDIMCKQVIQLGTSIQELLDMQAIQTQQLVMDIRPCILSSVINDAIERIFPITTEKNQCIQQQTLSAEIEVFVDPERTRQILINLLSNANKYSPRDTQITVSTRSDDDYAEVIVEDEGPGIPEEFLNNACDRFFQVPTEGAHLRGTGLGLAIVKEIAEIQGGDVKVNNCEQKGLCVRVRFPLRNARHSSAPQEG